MLDTFTRRHRERRRDGSLVAIAFLIRTLGSVVSTGWQQHLTPSFEQPSVGNRRSKSTMASMAGGLAKEIRYALRSFRKRPAFTFVAGATIALGVGANTTILSVVNGVLLQPLTYPGSEGLITVVAPWTASQGELGTMSYPGPVD